MVKPIELVGIEDGCLVYHRSRFEDLVAKIPEEAEVAVLSINGALRTGKSFYLNAILTYLAEGVIDHGRMKNYFSWSHGLKPDTSGIWVWGEPILLKESPETYLLLIDTQGMFDASLNLETTTQLFALSTLISSMQLYNVERRIQEDHLHHLELFSEYARAVAKADTGPPFQRLGFLVRDWIGYQTRGTDGQEESGAYLREIWTGLTDEAEKVRDNISRCYQTIACYCLPHPGLLLAEGRTDVIDELEPTFIYHLDQSIAHLITDIEPKRVLGEKLSARRLPDLFEGYLDLFSDGMPPPQTLLETTVAAIETEVGSSSRRRYSDSLTAAIGSKGVDAAELATVHQSAFEEAVDYADRTLLLGDPARRAAFKSQLFGDLENEYRKFSRLNRERLAWDSYIWFGILGAIAYLISTAVPIVCGFDVCVRVSGYSYLVFVVCALVLLGRLLINL